MPHRLGRALDWLVDAALPFALLAGVFGVWAAVVIVLAFVKWWAALAAFAVGLPFAGAVLGDLLERRAV